VSATPGVWNNIAYQLGLKKVHLDRARSYAESAVFSTSALLRNISLDSLDRRQLSQTSSLGNDWDTLGWVAFAEGNLNEAESYVSAAWQLEQHSEVAEHLGEIYEKRRNTEDATHYYALSLAARRPEPETRERLANLVGAAKVDSVVAEHQEELRRLRTLEVKNVNKKDGSAAFFILLMPGNAGLAKVDSVKFLSGSESLKDMSDALQTAKFSQTFPKADPVKILRRGVLSCQASSSDCTFVLDLPEDVKSLDQ
jgi:hypothetical protein